MHDEIDNMARAFYLTAENARGWDREPELLKEAFRDRARLVIGSPGFRPIGEAAMGLGGLGLVPLAAPTGGSAALDLDPPGFLAVLAGPRHVFHMANKAHRFLTGHRAVIDRPIREALPELKEQGFLDLIEEAYETGQPFLGQTLPLRIRMRRNGPLEQRHVDVAYKPIVNEHGHRIGILVEGRDVTGRIRIAP
ncbi:PAS domain-containing protein [Microvirga pudoricolor]|uniref:PAS domain-containing protein n=1 Tax=Microvirga pudoricolor TaxID=2778729 RepID=UPI0019502B17|nr:PAS domain-containing protein [Microvirga pudoricolor]MBM6595467.1 PAS domain-containing protein [Microvirga pudoricolor]